MSGKIQRYLHLPGGFLIRKGKFLIFLVWYWQMNTIQEKITL